MNDGYAFPWYPICYGMDKDTPPVSECCELAALVYSYDSRHTCSQECLLDGGKACCYDLCFLDTHKILTPNGINSEGLYNAFSYGKEMTSEMSEVLSNAMKLCLPLFNQGNGFTCNIPNGLFYVTKCIVRETFKNCPNYTISESCDELKRLLSACIEKTTPRP
ncbi:hypothetical protein PVAND_015298 [Polypedilum vanderplanki]|uniref:Uncharacterized protein n=1 Tax=Polypedilum vanderplanki TaxID=319348 RepID=A0A9J6BBR8_POLVA|nr:hypothetical protein PVAND_015298 [Polypedilum vanderplanki]